MHHASTRNWFIYVHAHSVATMKETATRPPNVKTAWFVGREIATLPPVILTIPTSAACHLTWPTTFAREGIIVATKKQDMANNWYMHSNTVLKWFLNLVWLHGRGLWSRLSFRRVFSLWIKQLGRIWGWWRWWLLHLCLNKLPSLNNEWFKKKETRTD